MNRDEYTGCLVKSRAGHDTGEIYLVTGEDEKTVLLCNGKNRSLSKPKRKNNTQNQQPNKQGQQKVKAEKKLAF